MREGKKKKPDLNKLSTIIYGELLVVLYYLISNICIWNSWRWTNMYWDVAYRRFSGGRGTGELGLRSHQLLYSTSMTMMTASITQIQCYCGTSCITINVSNFHF